MNVLVRTIKPLKVFKDIHSVRNRSEILYSIYSCTDTCTFSKLRRKLNLSPGLLSYKGDIINENCIIKDKITDNLVINHIKK